MFKKPLGTLKTSSPLKNSDRRKLKQRIIASYSNITNEEGDILVPDGILSVKFNNHVGEPGVRSFFCLQKHLKSWENADEIGVYELSGGIFEPGRRSAMVHDWEKL